MSVKIATIADQQSLFSRLSKVVKTKAKVSDIKHLAVSLPVTKKPVGPVTYTPVTFVTSGIEQTVVIKNLDKQELQKLRKKYKIEQQDIPVITDLRQASALPLAASPVADDSEDILLPGSSTSEASLLNNVIEFADADNDPEEVCYREIDLVPERVPLIEPEGGDSTSDASFHSPSESSSDSEDEPPHRPRMAEDCGGLVPETIAAAGRAPLLAPIYLSTLTASFGPYRKLILTSIDDPWFKTPVARYDDKMVLAASAFCSARLDMIEAYNATRHMTLLIGELAAPFLPTASYMPGDEAGEEFLKVVKHLFKPTVCKETFENITATTYATAREALGGNCLTVFPFTDAELEGLTEGQAIDTLKCLCSIAPAESSTNQGLLVVVTLVVTICKQGTVSSHYIDKIRQAIQQDVGRSIRLTPALISSVWGAYGQYVNENNVSLLMNHFLDHIMAESVRLRVTVQQAKYHALTVYQTIGRAFLAHPQLAWHLVENIAPGELTRYLAAIEAVQQNGYYGYSKDLDKVKAANFRHLGYLAKELMVRFNNESHLNDNKVFTMKLGLQWLIRLLKNIPHP